MTKIIHRPGRYFLILGTDLYDGDTGITFGWGFRPDAKGCETAWRQVWRIRFRWPISIRHRHAIPRTE